MTTPDKLDILEKIADAIERQLGVDREEVLTGVPFLELHPDFDSLSFLEIQLILEDDLKFEFDREQMSSGGRLPVNAVELADVVLVHLDLYERKQNGKKPKQVNAGPSATPG